jgi:hypothetical protein
MADTPGWLVLLLEVFLFVLVAGIVVIGGLLLRRVILVRGRSAVECLLRLPDLAEGDRWESGLARYEGDSLEWYRAIGVSLRPTHVVRRAAIEVLERRSVPAGSLEGVPGRGAVLRCTASGSRFDVGLPETAERATWLAFEQHSETMNPLTARYLNRLSDLLFILARVANTPALGGEGDVLWRPGGA